MIARLCERITGKTADHLSLLWSFHYLVTRSKWRAYWRTLHS